MNVKQFYLEVNGNYNNALSIMMNDILISKMLTKFISSDTLDQLVSLYEQKDYRSLFAAAHSLKGVAGNLALTPLFEIASFITEATRNEDGANLDKEIEEVKKYQVLLKEKYSLYLA